MAAGKKTGGRKAGVPNRTGQHVKDGLVRAFEDLGGQAGLVAWAKSHPNNKAKLYEWWARMAPKEIVADVKGDLNINLVSYADSTDPAD